MKIALEKIRNLIDTLNYHTKLYDKGIPEITDKQWDDMYFELDNLEKEYSIYFNDSPTQHISYEVVNSLEKVAHNHDMLSLEKTKALKDIKDFLGNVPYLAMCKMDGLTCSLKYVEGQLVSAETRGNGKIGENILHNAKVIPSIPKEIPYKEELIIDGEIICSKIDFKEFEGEYKNPRNFASGSIRLLDAKECSKRKLQFVAWDVIKGFEDKKLSDKLWRLGESGFTVVPFNISLFQTDEKLNWSIDKLTENAEDLGYPIDGLVFKYDDIEYGRSLGQTSHHFKNAMAYKFYDETYTSSLKTIEWTMGRTGVLTPVAVFEPIEIDGSTVERASLHNISIMEELSGGFERIGDTLHIYKANMIIPQVSKWEHNEEYSEDTHLSIPEVCPICGGKTEIKMDIDTKVLYCSNPSCEGKLINRLDHFCGKKGLDIKGLSKATLEKLIDWGWVSNCEDIFKLNYYSDAWMKKPGFGEKSVDKVLTAIEYSKECELSSFIASLGIPLIGSTASKELAKVFSTWEDFIKAVESKYHFWDIPNFGYEMHTAIVKFDYTEAKSIYENYLKIKTISPVEEETNTNLDGLVFVITGKLTHFKNRDALKDTIEKLGGKVVGSISGKTNYLINNDVESTSSKNLSAKKLGIPILSEENFLETFGIY